MVRKPTELIKYVFGSLQSMIIEQLANCKMVSIAGNLVSQTRLSPQHNCFTGCFIRFSTFYFFTEWAGDKYLPTKY